MDERTIKRLLVIVGVSLIAIFIFKAMMSRTIINMNSVVAEKKHAVPAAPVSQETNDSAIAIETSSAAAASEVGTLDVPTASGVGEVR